MDLTLFFIVQLFFAIYLYLTIQKVAKDKLFLQQLDNAVCKIKLEK